MSISKHLIRWYSIHKRDLPWRNTLNPYYIWISEVILQQTRVNQGRAYYDKFIEIFPDIFSLANANEDKVLKVWQGLGYYSRARNMHEAAKQIVKEYNGKFPVSHAQILKLKGIGEYTAAAISSFAYNKPHAVVDGNVYRVLSRLYNNKTPINSGKGKKEFSSIAQEILNLQQPGLHNQAMMELGAMVCTPKSPLCENCCVQQYCLAFKANTQEKLPVKLKKLSIKKRYFFYFLLESKGKLLIRKRNEKDIWKGLYELVLIETEDSTSAEKAILQFKQNMLPTTQTFTVKSISPLFTHQLSHQTIYTHFINIELADLKKVVADYTIIPKSKLSQYAFPILIINYLHDKFKQTI